MNKIMKTFRTLLSIEPTQQIVNPVQTYWEMVSSNRIHFLLNFSWANRRHSFAPFKHGHPNVHTTSCAWFWVQWKVIDWRHPNAYMHLSSAYAAVAIVFIDFNFSFWNPLLKIMRKFTSFSFRLQQLCSFAFSFHWFITANKNMNGAFYVKVVRKSISIFRMEWKFIYKFVLMFVKRQTLQKNQSRFNWTC